MTGENYINHIALVLDASSSMSGLTRDVIKVADNQIKYLAQRSKELDQETRITVYTFADKVTCAIYDKDVLRLPSIGTLYSPYGNTALIDATIKSQEDLAATAQLYGDHAFLTYVLTDGQENRSQKRPSMLTDLLSKQPDNWTVACFVPDRSGEDYAQRVGFFGGNISQWDTTSKGFEAAGEQIRQATENFMQARATGTFKGTKGLFTMNSANLNAGAVKQANLKALPSNTYVLIPVVPGATVPLIEKDNGKFVRIDDFVNAATGYGYRVGKAYYQLSKTEKIQGQKQLAVVEKKTGKVYVGAEVRDLLGLGSTEARVKPEYNEKYDVYVQSTSVNRHLPLGTKLLVLN